MSCRTIRIFFLSFLLSLILVACQSPSPDEATQEYLKQYTDEKQPLAIDYYSPEGLTEVTQNKLVIHFTQPMVPLSAVGSRAKSDFVKITPRLEGYFKWVNSKTLIFQTKGDLPFATEYNVTVKAGEQSLLGFALIKEFRFQFYTPSPQVKNITPKQGEESIDREQIFKISFNQQLNPQKGAGFFKLLVEPETAVPLQVFCPALEGETTAPETCSILHVRPEQTLPKNTRVNLKVLKGLTGIEGPRSSQVEENYHFRTYQDFRIEAISCSEGICSESPTLIINASTPIDEETFAKFVTFDPPLETQVEYYAYWSSYEKKFYYYPELKPFTDYTITLKQGLTDQFGQVLQTPFTHRFKTAHLPAAFNFSYEREQVQHYHGGLNLGFVATNILTATASYKKNLTDAEIIGLYATPDTLFDQFDAASSWDLVQGFQGEINDKKKFYPVPYSQLAGAGESAIILSHFMSPEIVTYDPETKTYNTQRSWFVKQITDLAIDAKMSDGDGLIWVSSLKTGLDIPLTEIRIYDQRGQLLHKGVTDKSGVLKIPGRDELKHKSRSLDQDPKKSAGQPFYIFASKGTDRAYISSQWQDGLGGYYYGYDDGYEDEADADVVKNKQSVRAHMLTDRGLYKPGEEVQIKGYLRSVSPNGLSAFAEPVYLKIHEPQNAKPVVLNVTPNGRGNFTTTYTIPVTNPLGHYSIELASDQSWVEFTSRYFGYHGFQVESFRIPEFKVGMVTPQQEILQSDPIAVNLSAHYLYGAPMREARVSYTITKSLDAFTPTHDGNWRFGRILNPDSIVDDLLQGTSEYEDSKLDSEGNAVIHVRTDSTMLDPVRYVLEAEVHDLSGQSQAAGKGVIVHPASFYIGAKLNQLFYTEGEELPLLFTTMTPDGHTLFDKQVQANLIQVKWVTVKREILQGQYQHEYEKKENRIDGCEEIAREKENRCLFYPKESGYYYFRLTAKDEKGRVAQTEIPVYVSGSGYSFWQDELGHELELVSDKKYYKRGDVAKVLIKSPYYEANALITIERDTILSYELKKLTGSSPIIEIPIEAGHAPNIFVNVVLVRGATQVDATQGQVEAKAQQALVKAGQIELQVEPDQKNIELKVMPVQAVYKPGEMAELEFELVGNSDGDEGEITVMVVDEGVLLAGGYELRNPLETFFAPYDHKMNQLDARTRYVGKQGLEQKLEDPASGGGDGARFRQEFIPLAYFNGEVKPQGGKARVAFKIPDQLTTFKVMAIANANTDRFGLATTAFKTQKDLMIRPALPRFLRVSDKIASRVVLHNNTPDDMDVEIHVAASPLKVVSGETGRIKVPANADVVHEVGLLALKETVMAGGEPQTTAEVTFSARAGDISDDVMIKIPVYLDRAEETVATSGVSAGEVSEFMEKTPDIDAGYGSLKINLSSNLLAKLRLKVNQLKLYPYDCLEQRLSKIYPFVLFPNRDDLFAGQDADRAARFAEVKRFIAYLRSIMSYSGEFAYWPLGTTDPALTVMVAEFLLAAKDAGHDVDSLLPKIKDRLFEYLKGEHVSLKGYSFEYLQRLKMNTLSLFDRMGEPQYAYYEGLKSGFAEMDAVTQARFAEMLFAHDKNDALVQEWLHQIDKLLRVKGDTAYFEAVQGEYYFGMDNRVTTALMAQALLRVKPDHPFLFQVLNYLVSESGKIRYRSSLDLISTLKAMKVYHDSFPVEDPVTAAILMNDQEVVTSELSKKRPEDHLDIPLDKLPNKVKLRIQKKEGAMLFYDVSYHYALKEFRPYGVEQGISISREYYDLNGQPVKSNQLHHGQTYQVVLNFYFADEVNFLAIEETVAAGLEPVNFALQTARKNFQDKVLDSHQDLRWYIDHKEFHDRKILLFANHVPRGFYDFTYYVNVTNQGEYLVPPAKAIEMYHPEIFGTTASEVVEVK